MASVQQPQLNMKEYVKATLHKVLQAKLIAEYAEEQMGN